MPEKILRYLNIFDKNSLYKLKISPNLILTRGKLKNKDFYCTYKLNYYNIDDKLLNKYIKKFKSKLDFKRKK